MNKIRTIRHIYKLYWNKLFSGRYHTTLISYMNAGKVDRKIEFVVYLREMQNCLFVTNPFPLLLLALYLRRFPY